MKEYITTVGFDLGDKSHRYCVLNGDGEVEDSGAVVNTKAALKVRFEWIGRALVVMEAGVHSAWVSAYVKTSGHEVLVANPRKLAYLTRDEVKTDLRDAECLARIGRADRSLLKPIVHRGPQAQADLAVVKARDACVQMRTALIAQVRSLVQGNGRTVAEVLGGPLWPQGDNDPGSAPPTCWCCGPAMTATGSRPAMTCSADSARA